MKLSYLIFIVSLVSSSVLQPMNRSFKKRKIDQLSMEQLPAKRRKLLQLIEGAKRFVGNSFDSYFDDKIFASPQQELLFIAASEGDCATIEYMLERRINMNINKRTPKGHTLLQRAAKEGNLCATKMLLKYKAQVNLKNGKEKTALHYAARHGHVDVAQVLLADKAQVNAKDRADWAPLHVAVKYGHTDMVNFLLKNDADIHARGKVRDEYIDLGKDRVNPLHIAVYRKNIRMIELLLDAGANIDALTKRGYSALYLAIGGDFKRCAQLLLKRGALLNILPKEQGRRFIGLYKILTTLLEIGADVNATDNKGETLLHFAAEQGDVQSVQLLLNTKNILVDESDEDGFTPLFQAVRNNKPEIVQLLLATNKVNVNKYTVYDQTPLKRAVWDKDQEITYQLLRAGAQGLRWAWNQRRNSSEIKKIIKRCQMLCIPHLWQVVRTLRKDIALGRGNVEENKKSEEALYNMLQQKQKVFDRFMLVTALQNGWGHVIGRVKSVQGQFMAPVDVVAQKINKLKKAAFIGDVQQVGTLLQKEYLLPDMLKEILNDKQVTNQAVKDIMEKRLSLQTNRVLKPQDVETIFADYVEAQKVIQSSNLKNESIIQ